jgi:L-rhamnose mutarotase
MALNAAATAAPPTGALQRHCLILDLKDDARLIAQYEAWHRPGGPPAAVTNSIRNAGIVEMEIFRSGNRLVMLMQVDASFDARRKAEADALDPEVQAWERLMNGFQQAIPWARADEKWVPAESIYRLSDQP